MLSSTLRLIIWKLFAFFIHVFITLLVAIEEKRRAYSVQKNKCVFNPILYFWSVLQTFLMYYNENESDNEKQIAWIRDIIFRHECANTKHFFSAFKGNTGRVS